MQDGWVIASHLWNHQEKSLCWHDRAYPGELGRFFTGIIYILRMA
jgi:hypothetical protein